MVYKHFWYTFEAAPPFRIVGVSSPFTLPTQLPKRPPIQFATGLLLNAHTHEIVVSFGEMDCHASIARFALDATLASTRRHAFKVGATPAAQSAAAAAVAARVGTPLLNILLVAPGVEEDNADGGGEGHEGDGGGDAERASGRKATDWRRFRFLPLLERARRRGHAVTLLLTQRCHVPDALGEKLDVWRVRRGCLTCSWDTAGARQTDEADSAWARRLFRQITCYTAPIDRAVTARLGTLLRGAARLAPPLRRDACLLLCGGGELLALCLCAAQPPERTAAVTTTAVRLALLKPEPEPEPEPQPEPEPEPEPKTNLKPGEPRERPPLRPLPARTRAAAAPVRRAAAHRRRAGLLHRQRRRRTLLPIRCRHRQRRWRRRRCRCRIRPRTSCRVSLRRRRRSRSRMLHAPPGAQSRASCGHAGLCTDFSRRSRSRRRVGRATWRVAPERRLCRVGDARARARARCCRRGVRGGDGRCRRRVRGAAGRCWRRVAGARRSRRARTSARACRLRARASRRARVARRLLGGHGGRTG